MTLRRLFFLVVPMLALSMGLAACGLFGGDGGSSGCNNLQVSVDQNKEFLVSYILEVSGKATVSQVTYQSDQGKQQVSTPTQVESPNDSWSKSVTIRADTRAFASAEASTQSGTVTLRLKAVSGGTQIEKEAVCEAQSQ